MQIWSLLQPRSQLLQFNSYNFPLGLLCPTLLCIFGSDWGPSHLSWLCSVDSGSKLVLSEADTQSCPGCAVAGYAQAHVCVCVRVDMGWRWEALPPILLLLKSSHERSCQELQCGLSRPSQGQSRLHDATHSPSADPRSCIHRYWGRGERSWTVEQAQQMMMKKSGEKRRCCSQNPKLCEGVMHKFYWKEERN